MKKLLNLPANYVDESLAGLCSAFPGFARTGATGRVITRRNGPKRGGVGVVTGGGFGHLPVFAGYVGQGLLNSCAVGDVFADPPADVCADAIRAADGVAGVDIARSYVGHYATSMEMAGRSLSLLFLDAELETLLDAPTDCPFWPRT